MLFSESRGWLYQIFSCSAEPSNPNANPKQLIQALEGKTLLLLIVWDEKGSLPGRCVFSLKAVPTLEGQFLWQLERASRGDLQGQLFPLEDYCVYTGVGGRHAVGGLLLEFAAL